MQRQTTRGARFVALLLFVFALPAAVHTYTGVGLRIIRSGSMAPAIAPGDAVVVRSTSATDLRHGDVSLLFHAQDGVVAAHRIVDIERAGSVVTLTTKGDANPTADMPVAMPRSAAVERVALVIPDVGYVLQTAGSTPVLVGGVALGLMVWLFLEFRNRRLPAASESNP